MFAAPCWRCALFLFGLACAAAPAVADDLAIPGSGNAEYVLGRLAEAFNAGQNRHRIIIPPSSGTAGALRDVSEGSAALGRVGRALSAEESGRGLTYLPLGREPVVVVAGAGVTARHITATQLVDVYRGRITDWQALGGAPGPIRAIGREASDASRQALQQIIRPLADVQFAASVKMVNLDPQLIELLDRYPTSLGILNRSALAACKTKVVFLALDGVEPTPDNFASGRYAAGIEFGLIYRNGRLPAAGRAFVDFVTSAEGVRILSAHGVIPFAR